MTLLTIYYTKVTPPPPESGASDPRDAGSGTGVMWQHPNAERLFVAFGYDVIRRSFTNTGHRVLVVVVLALALVMWQHPNAEQLFFAFGYDVLRMYVKDEICTTITTLL